MKYILFIIMILTVPVVYASNPDQDLEKARRVRAERRLQEKTEYRLLAEKMHKGLLGAGAHELAPITVLGTLANHPNWTCPSLENFLNLRVLDLQKMNLSRLPESMTRLQHLEELILHENPLCVIPDWIGDFPCLSMLDVSSAKLGLALLHGFPDTASRLTQLESLDLSENDLQVVPYAINGMVSLQFLDLSHNKLRVLPSHFSQLSLRSLYLNNNSLRLVPAEIMKMSCLQTLWLRHNFLSELPASLLQNQTLISIHTEGNHSLLEDSTYIELLARKILNPPLGNEVVVRPVSAALEERRQKYREQQAAAARKKLADDLQNGYLYLELPIDKASYGSSEPLRIGLGDSVEPPPITQPVHDVSEKVPGFIYTSWQAGLFNDSLEHQHIPEAESNPETTMVKLGISIDCQPQSATEKLLLDLATANITERPSVAVIGALLSALKLDANTVEAMLQHLPKEHK